MKLILILTLLSACSGKFIAKNCEPVGIRVDNGDRIYKCEKADQ